jgi:cobalamin transport system permease protein
VSHLDRPEHRRLSARARATTIGVVALIAAVLVGLLVGPVRIGAGNVMRWLFSFGDPPPGMSEGEALILGDLRLPRVIVAGLVGASLAASGAAYQAVFRNPLADPYLLGAAAGAGLGATIAVAYGPSSALDLTVPLAAFKHSCNSSARRRSARSTPGSSGGSGRPGGTTYGSRCRRSHSRWRHCGRCVACST